MADPVFRHNNPGNIRYNPNLPGVVAKSPGGFSIFKNYYYGLHAMKRLLINAYLNKGFNTVKKIIYKYAPPSENNTELYISQVTQWSGLSRDQVLTEDDLKKLIPAMIRKETSQQINPGDISKADEMVLQGETQVTKAGFPWWFTLLTLGSVFLLLFKKKK